VGERFAEIAILVDRFRSTAAPTEMVQVHERNAILWLKAAARARLCLFQVSTDLV
jgi:hypothetical protein